MAKRKYDPKKVSKSIGLRIREVRQAKGLTLEACEELGYPDWTHLQKVEAGKNITIHTLVKIANLFNVSPADLLNDLN
jgi:transcriptional regulator with XRE-family HTH domain